MATKQALVLSGGDVLGAYHLCRIEAIIHYD
jgi:hypothetical protein